MSLAGMYINIVDQWIFGEKSLLLAFIRKVHSRMFWESSIFKDDLHFAHKELTIKVVNHRSQLVNVT